MFEKPTTELLAHSRCSTAVLCPTAVILFSICYLLMHLTLQVNDLSINIYSPFELTLLIQPPGFVGGPI